MASPPLLPHITVLGSLNMDLVSYVPHHPQPGETLTSNSFAISPGGKGANQAVACAKLSRSSTSTPTSASASIRMLGAVGTDPYGQTLLDSLSGVGIDVSAISRSSDATTGVAIIIVDEPTGENRIIFSPGANYTILPAHVSSPPVFSLGGHNTNNNKDKKKTDLLVMQLEIPLSTVAAATHAAHAASIPVLLNAAPAPDAADAAVLASDVFPHLAHLVVNETEATALCGAAVADLDELSGLERAGRWFLDRGVGTVVITLGARGAFWMAGGGVSGLVPAEKVAEVVDTTAAGDTFVGVYALRVAATTSSGGIFDVESVVKAAAAAAALTVQRKGAQSSIPWADELR